MKIGILVLYALMMVAVIITTAKKSATLNEFLIGGRKVGPWMSAFSYGSSYFSAVIIIGYAGATGWDVGFSAIWVAIGNAVIGSFLAWSILAKPTRMMGERLKVTTIPSFFEKRYHSKGLKFVSAILIFVFLIPYSASVYKGLGTVFQLIMGFDYTLCIIVVALLSSLYLFLGGYKATAVSDFIQGFIMIVGIVLVVGYVVKGGGGLANGLAKLGQEGIGGPGYNSLFPPAGKGNLLWPNVFLTSFGVLGMPQMIHKFFAIENTKSIKQAKVISTVFALIIAGGAYLLGSFGRVILSQIPAANGETAFNLVQSGAMAKDMIVPTMIIDQIAVKMPDIVQGLFVVLLLSASISTLTSLVLSSASVISIDLIQPLFPKMKAKQTTTLMRILCLLFVALSLLIHFLMQNTPIVSLMSFSWGVIGGSFLAPFLYGLLWKKTTKMGVYASFFSSLVIALVPPIVLGNMAITPLCGTLAMASGLVVLPVVSLATQKKYAIPAETLALAFGE